MIVSIPEDIKLNLEVVLAMKLLDKENFFVLLFFINAITNNKGNTLMNPKIAIKLALKTLSFYINIKISMLKKLIKSLLDLLIWWLKLEN